MISGLSSNNCTQTFWYFFQLSRAGFALNIGVRVTNVRHEEYAMYTRILYLSALFVTSAVWPSFAIAQATASRGMDITLGTIVGAVRTSDNHAAANVRVELEGAFLTTSPSAYTAADGSYELTDVPAGEYTVIARTGMQEARESIHINGGRTFLNLTFSSQRSTDNNHDATVSAAQLRVPRKAQDLLEKARDAINKGRMKDVASNIDKALAIYPQYADALTLRAALELQDNREQDARSDAEKAVEYDPNYGRAYVVLGAIYSSMREFDLAIRTLNHGIAIEPNAWQGYYELSKAFLKKGECLESLRQAERASRLSSVAYAPVHIVKAYSYIGLGNAPAAITEFKIYLKQEPNGPVSQQVRQTLLGMEGRQLPQ
jgi:tetratricopeptide (TPR) repeat protein